MLILGPLDCSVLTSEERLQSPWTVVLASILQAGSKQAPQEMVTAMALALRTLGRKSEDTDGIETVKKAMEAAPWLWGGREGRLCP